MKLDAEILSIAAAGENLEIKVQANEVAAAEWREMVTGTFHVADTKRTREAMRVGRRLSITIEPK